MWVNKHEPLNWNPWDTDPEGKKRPCHIKGLQKMNEFHNIKQRQDSEESKKRSEMKKGLSSSTGKLGLGSKGSNTYSTEFAKMSYRDEGMKRLVEENKGTTSSYQYS